MREYFTVKKYNSGGPNYVNYTNAARQYIKDKFSLLLLTSDYLYVGFPRKFYYAYAELSYLSANLVTGDVSAEYYNGSTWENLAIDDETDGLNRSGYITFSKPDDWTEVEIDSKSQFYIRLKVSEDMLSPIELWGLNIVFSNHDDLIEERANIVSKHGDKRFNKSWIDKHQAARREIMQNLRNRGHRKTVVNSSTPNQYGDYEKIQYKDLTAFDLLDFEQVRQASKWLTLSKIFKQELSDSEEDKYWMLGEAFEDQYSDAMDLYFLSMDLNDNGELDEDEGEAYVLNSVPINIG
jgi:hypothetical protein